MRTIYSGWYKFLILIGLLILPIEFTYAKGFTFGLGGGYHYFSMANISVGPSLHSGFGYLGELRYGFFGRASSPLTFLTPSNDSRLGGSSTNRESSLGLDLFLTYQRDFTKNVSNPSSEAHVRTAYGVGADLLFDLWFIGTQYQKASSTITQTGGKDTKFKYDMFGYRAGIKFKSFDGFTIQITGIFQTGVALALENGLATHQPVKQFSGVVVFQHPLFFGHSN